jgi:hypothetical protein
MQPMWELSRHWTRDGTFTWTGWLRLKHAIHRQIEALLPR